MSVPKFRLVGFTISFGDAGGVQLHGTFTVLAEPVNVKVALAGQVVLGTVIVTVCD